ncbi:hypothetical protein [Nodosilinea nodulosa]|uniref:hypothetical protein n=1 Tax=Nodosilinea nodulosa TaxID=416001 RepID=UPI0003138A4E|nr:hypothetical protein [Nodosilinea nodulosa]
MQLTIDTKIKCIRSDQKTCVCCEGGLHVYYRKLELIDHGIPKHILPDLEAWLNQQIDFRKYDGKIVKVTFEIQENEDLNVA